MEGMRRALLCMLLASGQLSAAELAGRWSGRLQIGARVTDVILTLSQRGNEITGTIANAGGAHVSIEKTEWHGNEFTFEARFNAGKITKFRLRLTAAQNALTGEVVGADPPITLRLERKAVPGVFRVGNGVSAPLLLHKVNPEYTEEARRAQLDGNVLLYVEINDEGRAVNGRVLRSLGKGLDEKALECVRLWRFKPGMKADGTIVTIEAQIEVNFKR